jgi:hypothetical protein
MPDTRFKPLPLTRLTRGVPCFLPQAAVRTGVDATSPALAVMTDLQHVTLVTIARDTSLDEANRIMRLCHVRYLLVADAQRHLLGIVTDAGTKGDKPLAVAHTLGVRPSELVVGDVMVNKHDDAQVMHLSDVTAAKGGQHYRYPQGVGHTFLPGRGSRRRGQSRALWRLFLVSDRAPDGA